MVSVSWVMTPSKDGSDQGQGLPLGFWCVHCDEPQWAMPIVMPCDNTRDDNHFPMAITSAYTIPCVKVCLIAPDIFEGIELIILCLACEWAVRVREGYNVRKYELWSGLERADRNAFLNLCPPLYCNVTVLSLCQGWKGTLVQIWLSTHPIISLPKRDSITEF